MSKYMSIFSIVSLINGSYIYLFSEFHTCDIIDVQSIDYVSLPKIVRRLMIKMLYMYNRQHGKATRICVFV